jgi:hypothetical protein
VLLQALKLSIAATAQQIVDPSAGNCSLVPGVRARVVEKSFKIRRMQHRTSKGPGPANRSLTKQLIRFHLPVSNNLSAVLSHTFQGVSWCQSVLSVLLVPPLLSLSSPYYASHFGVRARVGVRGGVIPSFLGGLGWGALPPMGAGRSFRTNKRLLATP